MSMLARYKKGGGIIELVKLIEEAGEPKRNQLLSMIRNEDAEFAAQVEARLFSYDQFRQLPEDLVAEVISSSSPKVMALALYGESDERWVKLAERCMGQNFAEYKSEKEVAAAQPPNAGQIEAARKKIISEARKLEAEGKIKLPFSDNSSDPIKANKLNVPGAGGTAPAAVGTATEADGCPPIESFGLEPPPPGLTGERLETFLKAQLEKA